MRDRITVVLCVLGAMAVVGGIVLYADSRENPADNPGSKGPARHFGREGILIDGPFITAVIERQQDASQPVTGRSAPPPVRTSMSPAGGAAPAPAARPAFVTVPSAPICAQSLLGSVMGLIGALLGGGGAC